MPVSRPAKNDGGHREIALCKRVKKDMGPGNGQQLLLVAAPKDVYCEALERETLGSAVLTAASGVTIA